MSRQSDSDSSTLYQADVSPGANGIHGTRPMPLDLGPQDGNLFSNNAVTKTNSDEPLLSPATSTIQNTSSRPTSYLRDLQMTGPSARFHPTTVRVNIGWKDQNETNEKMDPTTSNIDQAISNSTMDQEVQLVWRSRDHRKGRNSVVIRSDRKDSQKTVKLSRRIFSEIKTISRNILRMFTKFMYWDLAFWSGWSYAVGSLLFVIDGLAAWMPVAYPGSDWGKDTAALLFFIGALFYQIGATTAYLEAVNDGSFSSSPMRRFLDGHEHDQKKLMDEKIHHFFGHVAPFHHRKDKKARKAIEAEAANIDPEVGWNHKDTASRPGSIYPPDKQPAPRRGGLDLGAEKQEGHTSNYLTFRWWPTWHCLRTHHVYEIGYIANVIQLPGATLYGICGLVGLPGIYDTLDAQWKVNAAYWIPQVVASVCFLLAGLLFTLETQEKWYKPEPKVIGWWIGAWASIGSIGFLLSAAFGIAAHDNHSAEYESPLTSMWGSVGYLLSSLLQWYEAVNKNPVAEFLHEPGHMKSSQIHGL